MRKSLITIILFVAVVFQFCSTAKKAQVAPTTTFAASVQPIIQANCGPCHLDGGKQANLNSYAAAQFKIDDIIARIQKNPNEKGFMPFRHPKLPDSTIQVFVKWKNEGLL